MNTAMQKEAAENCIRVANELLTKLEMPQSAEQLHAMDKAARLAFELMNAGYFALAQCEVEPDNLP